MTTQVDPNRADKHTKRGVTAQSSQVDTLPVVSRRTLRPAQGDLYDLITEKLQAGMPITLEEGEHIWRTRIATRRMHNGVPHRLEYYPDPDPQLKNWYARDVPMTQDEITYAVLNWLTKNIGVLVMRGYLKVIPMVELEPSRKLSQRISKTVGGHDV